MGGGGGFSPIPIITDLIIGGGISGLMSGMSPKPGGDSGAAEAAAAIQAENARRDQAAAEAALEARAREKRQERQAALLEQARSARRAAGAQADGLAQTLGAPAVETATLKEKLGQ